MEAAGIEPAIQRFFDVNPTEFQNVYTSV